MVFHKDYEHGTFPLSPEQQGGMRALFYALTGKNDYDPTKDTDLKPPELATDPDFLRGVENVQNSPFSAFLKEVITEEVTET